MGSKAAALAFLVACAMGVFKAQFAMAANPNPPGPNLPSSNPMDRPEARRGKGLFENSCAGCHGSDARGGIGPSLIASSLVRHDENGDKIGPVVLGGIPAKGMPSFASFTSAQISELVAYLHARIEVTNSVESSGPVGGYSLQQLLVGNAAAGKAFFSGKGGCSSCHSPTGDLAGIADKYTPADLESRMLYPPADLRHATVTMRNGSAFEGKLFSLDAFSVAVVDAKGVYRSWPLDDVSVKVTDPLEAHRKLLHRYDNSEIHNLFAYLETLR